MCNCFFIILECKTKNNHVNDLLNFNHVSYRKPTNPGWDIDCWYGSYSSYSYYRWDNICSNWYCYKLNEHEGSIKTTLFGNGRAKLDFGNCYTSGIVKVFVDNTEIASTTHSTTSKTVEFDYNDGSELKIVEENAGIIMFNSFEVLSCTLTGKYDSKF